MPRLRFTIGRMLVAVAILAVLIVVLEFVWAIASLRFVDDAYIQWGAGNLVVQYLKDHDGRWPQGWDDLQPYFDAGSGNYWGFPISEYRRLIWIDWSAESAALEEAARTSERAPFRVIGPRRRFASEFTNHEPNETVHRYFRAKAQRAP